VGFGVYALGRAAESLFTVVGPVAGGLAAAALVVALIVRHRRARQ
jgi:hypothetical protein